MVERETAVSYEATRSGLPGYDPLIQGASNTMVIYGIIWWPTQKSGRAGTQFGRHGS